MSDAITLPFSFKPRTYQLDLLKAMDSGYRRAIARYHRRAGKDKTLFNLMIKKAFERVGCYYYFFPQANQGRRVIFDGADGSGMRFLAHIPEQLILSRNKVDMKIELINGSFIQIIGTDNYDKIRGSNPIGCVFSEFAFQDPQVWDVIRPIMSENSGWAVFNSSTNGKNHFYDLWQMAQGNDKWFTQNITVDDSLDQYGNRYISEEAIQEEIDAGMSPDMVQQEFYNSFNANAEGYYYLQNVNKAREEHRVGSFHYDPTLPVETYWDIGVGDSTAIWFVQKDGKEINLIDFYQNDGHGLDHYANKIKSLPFSYSSHNFPHDMSNTEFGTGRSRIEVAQSLLGTGGIRINILPKLNIEDGINAARMIFPRCNFNKDKCAEGIKCLENHKKKWDSKYQEYQNKAIKDWTSHASDAFRYVAVGITNLNNKNKMPHHKRYQRNSSIITSKNWMTA